MSGNVVLQLWPNTAVPPTVLVCMLVAFVQLFCLVGPVLCAKYATEGGSVAYGFALLGLFTCRKNEQVAAPKSGSVFLVTIWGPRVRASSVQAKRAARSSLWIAPSRLEMQSC